MKISVIIPANNEEKHISEFLSQILNQDITDVIMEVIVVANACNDKTVDRAREHIDNFKKKAWVLDIINIKNGGKTNALNVGDDASNGDTKIYLDADIKLDTDIFSEMAKTLSVTEPRYATGRLQLARAQSWFSRAYGEFWMQTPFIASGAVGAGIFGVNKLGRERWQSFPDIISDDTYVRLLFRPEERIEVNSNYSWPLVEGFSSLVKVRRRQDAGTSQIGKIFPYLLKNEGKKRISLLWLATSVCKFPVGFCVYAAVSIAVRLKHHDGKWSRGR